MPVMTTVPSTSAEVAAAVLDNIALHPEQFDMATWVSFEYGFSCRGALEPDGSLCGTTLCAAGWAAHVTGWRIVNSNHLVDVDLVHSDGTTETARTQIYVEKDGERRLLDDVGRDALGLTDATTFWYASDSAAICRLQEIAGRPAAP